MNDYCVTESTRCVGEEICEREMSSSEILKEIRKELTETLMVLKQIDVNVEGVCAEDPKIDEPKCLHDELKLTEHIAVDCMGLSHRIYSKLFGAR